MLKGCSYMEHRCNHMSVSLRGMDHKGRKLTTQTLILLS